MANNIIWQPHPGPQTRFLQSGVRDIFFGGAAGPGKSVSLIAAATRFFASPYYRARIFRRSRTQATELIIKARRIVPVAFPGTIWRASEWAFIHPSGGRLELGYLRHDNDLENEQGQEYQFVGFDEICQFPEHQAVYLFSRLRSDHGLPLQYKGTGNPGGIGHLWVKARYIDQAPPESIFWDHFTTPTGRKLRFSRLFIPARLEDNPTLGDDYEISLSTLDPKTYRALRLGDWDALIGQAFPEFDRRIHVMTWEQFFDRYGYPRIPDHWPRFMSFDWGLSHPFSVGWWTVDPFGRLIRYAEWYGAAVDRNGRRIPDKGIHMPTRDIARGILAREAARGDAGKIEMRFVDPAMKQHGSSTEGIKGPSLAEIFAEEGLYVTFADNDRIAGKQQMHDRLRIFDLEHPNGEIEETPGMFIMENCADWLRTIPVLDLDEKRPEDVDTKMEDHVFDESKYMLMSRPWRPPAPITFKRWQKEYLPDRRGWKG